MVMNARVTTATSTASYRLSAYVYVYNVRCYPARQAHLLPPIMCPLPRPPPPIYECTERINNIRRAGCYTYYFYQRYYFRSFLILIFFSNFFFVLPLTRSSPFIITTIMICTRVCLLHGPERSVGQRVNASALVMRVYRVNENRARRTRGTGFEETQNQRETDREGFGGAIVRKENKGRRVQKFEMEEGKHSVFFFVYNFIKAPRARDFTL